MAKQAYSALAETFMGLLSRKRLSNAAAFLVFDDVQAALLLDGAGPAAGALVAAGAHRLRAGPAANARVALVVQRVVRHVVLHYERPDLFLGPAQQRVDLHQVELRVPLHRAGHRPMDRLVAADRTDPGVEACHRPPQRQHLAVVAT